MINYLKNECKAGKELYLFGTGKVAERIFMVFSKTNVPITGFIDNAMPDGGVTYGKRKVISHNEFDALDRENTIICIANSYIKDVNAQLIDMGFTHIIREVDLAIEYKYSFDEIIFEEYDKPKVSILITVYNQWRYTYNCLESLKKYKNDCTFEIIIGDDCSTDETRDLEKYIKGVKVVRHPQNLNYLRNANDIAKYARGEYLLFLGNDVIATKDGWLDKYIEVIESDSKIAAVSGRAWIPTRMCWEYARNYDKNGEASFVTDFDVLQEAEEIEMEMVLIRKCVWEKVGGFDEVYLPAYFEDWDMFLKVIDEGYKLMYCPQVEFIHFCGTSYMNKAVQWDRNKQIFLERWKEYFSKKA